MVGTIRRGPRRRTMSGTLNATRFIVMAIAISNGWQAPEASPLEQGSEPLIRVLSAFDRGDSTATRIVGGHKTTFADQPWQVALVATRVPTNDKGQFCGGSIVASRWVVTAAHCVDKGTQPSQIVVLTGTGSLLMGGERQAVLPLGILVHDKWTPKAHNYDIALIHVQDDLIGQAIEPWRAADGEPKEKQEITVTGWGALAWGNSAGTNTLQLVQVPYVPRSKCNKKASYNGRVTDNMFCAGRDEGGKDACQGDSGGPATASIASQRRLVGIVSWGDGCGFPKKYGVYTMAFQFANWVQIQTGGEVAW
jgi:secreted trypsin-like serine protease